MEYKQHYSVLKNEVIEYLTEGVADISQATFSDCTFGAGGHTMALALIDSGVRVISFDQDPDAILNGKKILKERGLADQVTLVDSNFSNFSNKIDAIDENLKFDGVLLDLGVSSHHFDKGERGFSFREDANLDMRMDYTNDSLKTAGDLLSSSTREELVSIFSEYGEERYSKRIADKIVELRETEAILRTKQLENLIFHCYPKKDRYGKLNPATKVFQALRIAVNRELDVILEVIPQILPYLKMGGKIAIISFHSLEDRIVKNEFKKIEQGEIPFEILTKKPILPSKAEILENSRSRSAKLRVMGRVEKKKSKNKYANFSKLKND